MILRDSVVMHAHRVPDRAFSWLAQPPRFVAAPGGARGSGARGGDWLDHGVQVMTGGLFDRGVPPACARGRRGREGGGSPWVEVCWAYCNQSKLSVERFISGAVGYQ